MSEVTRFFLLAHSRLCNHLTIPNFRNKKKRKNHFAKTPPLFCRPKKKTLPLSKTTKCSSINSKPKKTPFQKPKVFQLKNSPPKKKHVLLHPIPPSPPPKKKNTLPPAKNSSHLLPFGIFPRSFWKVSRDAKAEHLHRQEGHGQRNPGGDFSPIFLVGGFDSTHLKNISQNGNLPQIGVKKDTLEPPPSFFVPRRLQVGLVWLVVFFFFSGGKMKQTEKTKKGGGRSLHKT